MFAEPYRIGVEELLENAASEEERVATKYAGRVLDGRYRFNDFLEEEGLQLEQEEKLEIGDAYREVVERTRGGEEAEDHILPAALRLDLDEEVTDDVLADAYTMARSLPDFRREMENEYPARAEAATCVYIGSMRRRGQSYKRAATQSEVADVSDSNTGYISQMLGEIQEVHDFGQQKLPDFPTERV